jgi:glycerol-3-phosphate acyltransferase PlsY
VTEIFNIILLSMAAFWLGACPFSVWVGRRLLDKDIRDYGDGNPGAANVFRAGDVKSGLIALALDIAKGFPFVFMAYSIFGFSEMIVMAIGLSAILGHAFSPFLRLKGGKAVATTFGVLLAFPQHELLIIFIVFILVAFLFIEPDAWTTMLAPAVSCNMYHNVGSMLEGFIKWVYSVLAFSPAALVVMMSAAYVFFLLPFYSLWRELFVVVAPTGLRTIIISQVGIILFMRWLVDSRFKEPVISVFLHPLGLSFLFVAAFCAIFRRAVGAGVRWKERIYSRESPVE